MRRLREVREHRDEQGVTLAEAAVTLLILSIVFIIVFDFLDRTSNLTVRTDTQARAEDESQRAMRTVTQHLRGARPITGTCNTAGFPTGYSDCIRFEVPRGVSTGATCALRTGFVVGLVDDPDVTAPADEKLLKMIRQEFTGATCAGGTPRTETLLARVVNDGTQPLFTYFASNGNNIPATSVTAVPNATTVRVTLSTRFRTGSAPIVFTNAAALRNNITR
jgi:Tfp pilus assembly protein PilW